MKKLGLLLKKQTESLVDSRLKESQALIIIKYAGLSAPALTTLRRSLEGAQAQFMVVKNSVARRVLKGAGKEPLVEAVDGPCGLVFSREEPVDTAKVLYDFAKKFEQLQVAGGYLHDKILQEQDCRHLSKLPSQLQLRAQVVMTINAPRVKFVMALNHTLRKFVVCLDRIKQKKEG